MHPALVAGLAGVLAIGGTAAVAYNVGLLDVLFAGEGPEVPCSESELFAVGSGDGKIDFRITTTPENSGAGHLCVYDSEHRKVWEHKTQLRSGTTQDFLAEVPSGNYWGMVEIGGTGGAQAVATSSLNLRWCSDGEVMEVQAEFHDDGIGIGGGGEGCGEIATTFANQGVNGQGDVVVPSDLGGSPGSGAAVAASLGIGSLVGIGVWRRRELSFLAAALFTRLAKPTILDQAVRARIYELVTHEPGIHGAAIAERLELAAGQTVHHLRVLEREHMLMRVASFGARHYFPYGKYSPQQARLLAALRHRAASRLYLSVLAKPGTTLTEASRHSGLSVGRASRVAQRLVEAGLVQRQPQGRTIVLTPAISMPA